MLAANLNPQTGGGKKKDFPIFLFSISNFFLLIYLLAFVQPSPPINLEIKISCSLDLFFAFLAGRPTNVGMAV